MKRLWILFGVAILCWLATLVLWACLAVTAYGADCCPGGNCGTTPAWQAAPIGVAPIPRTPAVVRGVSNVCRVQNHLSRHMNGGSGVLVYSDEAAGFAQVATVAHMFREGRGRIVVLFGSRQFPATIQHIDPTWDFAVLRIACPRGIPPVQIVTTAPAVGTRLHAGGFPRGGPFRWLAGRLRGWVGVRARPERWWFQMAGTAQDGDSGGIVCNGTGAMVGLISSTGGGMIVGPSWFLIAPHIGPPKQNTRPPANGGHQTETAAVIAELRAQIAALTKETKSLAGQICVLREIVYEPPPPIDVAEIAKRLPPITIWYRKGDGETVETQVLLGGRYELQPWYLRTVNAATGEETIEAIPPSEGFTLRSHLHD